VFRVYGREEEEVLGVYLRQDPPRAPFRREGEPGEGREPKLRECARHSRAPRPPPHPLRPRPPPRPPNGGSPPPSPAASRPRTPDASWSEPETPRGLLVRRWCTLGLP